jgi:hypothetical protein
MRSMVEGAQAVRKILRRQVKLRGKRPAHRARARSPLPTIVGRDEVVTEWDEFL